MSWSKNKTFVLGIFVLAAIGIAISYFITFKNIKPDNSCKPDIRTVIINGDSLEPLYKDKEEIKIDYNFLKCNGRIKRNDIVVYEYAQGINPIIKIIKGLPKDRISLDKGRIVVNGEIVRNSEGQEYKLTAQEQKLINLYINDYKGIIPEDSYLIMGNKIGSIGSNRLGLVGKEGVLGKLVK
ncbi:MAG TPA: signal peptidase I [Candidatus Pacearchaeota archaeon]|nr:signal peptidase I [Candidatus Pacearchaeota archaeon]HQI74413.1 signal peptidase I [Candidatus Pacearchaeota archaeon]